MESEVVNYIQCNVYITPDGIPHYPSYSKPFIYSMPKGGEISVEELHARGAIVYPMQLWDTLARRETSGR